MKILVTGGAGFIGSHVVAAYKDAGHEVAVLDSFYTGKRENIPADVAVFEADITNPAEVAAVFAQFQPDVVNHHAAQVSVTHSVREPLDDAQRNILGTITLLEAIKALPVLPKVIYASSGGAMYGEVAVLPVPENTIAHPASPYGLSKYVAEQYVWLYALSYSMKATVLRYSNVYGPRQDPHGEAGVCAVFSERMYAGSPVTIFGDGSATRDYVFVEDVAQASVAALEKGDGQAFNICTGIEISTQQVFDQLQTVLEYAFAPQYAPLRPGEIQHCALSPNKANEQLGWKAAHSFEEGIQKTALWYKNSSHGL